MDEINKFVASGCRDLSLNEYEICVGHRPDCGGLQSFLYTKERLFRLYNGNFVIYGVPQKTYLIVPKNVSQLRLFRKVKKG